MQRDATTWFLKPGWSRSYREPKSRSRFFFPIAGAFATPGPPENPVRHPAATPSPCASVASHVRWIGPSESACWLSRASADDDGRRPAEAASEVFRKPRRSAGSRGVLRSDRTRFRERGEDPLATRVDALEPTRDASMEADLVTSAAAADTARRMRYAGELAALGTAACWAAGSNFFAAAGRRMGSVVLNRLRVTLALLFLGATLLLVSGTPWPYWATTEQIALLALSGFIGFVFGDGAYFRALVILGPGRASLLASVGPAMTALLGIPILGERLGPLAWLGMGLTLAGIGWVLREREQGRPDHVEGSWVVGIAAGVLGALGQAGGYVISKLALRTGIDPLPATVVRVAAATASVWLIAAAQGAIGPTLAALRDKRAAALMAGGAAAGPFLGVTLSLIALQRIEAGVAASITAIYPILTLLIAARVHRERLTWRTLAGALVAVSGVVVLFVR